MKAFVEQAYVICSTNQLLERKLKYFRKLFHEENNYPKYNIKEILDKAFEKHNHKNAVYTILNEQNEPEHTIERKYMLGLSYQGKKRYFIMKSMKKDIAIDSVNA